jgi:hypothetical protein
MATLNHSVNLAGRSGVVPFQSFINVCGTTDVMVRRIGFAAEDIHESGSDATHARATCSSFEPSQRANDFHRKTQREGRRTQLVRTTSQSEVEESEVRLRLSSLAVRRPRSGRPSRSSREA